MAKRNEVTSERVARAASRILNCETHLFLGILKSILEEAKIVAASALTQTPNKTKPKRRYKILGEKITRAEKNRNWNSRKGK